MANLMMSTCSECGEDFLFAETEADATEEEVPFLPGLSLGTVAGIPDQIVWILECPKCDTYYVHRKTPFNGENIASAREAQRYKPDTKIPSAIYCWASCSIQQFVDELAAETNRAVIKKVGRILRAQELELPLPDAWEEVLPSQ